MPNKREKTVKPIVFDWKSVGIDPKEIRMAEGEEYSTLREKIEKAEESLKAANDFRRYARIAHEKEALNLNEKEFFSKNTDFDWTSSINNIVISARINLAKKYFEALKTGVFDYSIISCSEIKTIINRIKRTIKYYPIAGITKEALSFLLFKAKRDYLIQEFKRAKESSIAFEFLTNGWGKEAVGRIIKEGVVSWDELSKINKELAEKIKEK
jgi:hypothetical protein